MCPPWLCQRGRIPFPPPLSTICWWSCVRDNCRCTNTGRILRFWHREWYILPQRRCFQPVIAGQHEIPPQFLVNLDSSDGGVKQDEEPFATLELEPKRIRFHFEYQVSAATQAQNPELRRGDENSYVTSRVRVEPGDGSTVPPSYEATVGKKNTQCSRVFVDYYLVERPDRRESKKVEIVT